MVYMLTFKLELGVKALGRWISLEFRYPSLSLLPPTPQFPPSIPLHLFLTPPPPAPPPPNHHPQVA